MQQIAGGLFEFLISGPLSPPAGDKNRIPSRFDWSKPDRLPQSALHLIPCYRVPNTLPDQNSESIMVKTIGKDPYHQVPVGRAPAFPVDLIEPFVAR